MKLTALIEREGDGLAHDAPDMGNSGSRNRVALRGLRRRKSPACRTH